MTDDSDDRLDELEERVRRLESDLIALRADAGIVSASLPPPPPPPSAAQLPPPTGAPLPASLAGPDAVGRPFVLESETVLKWGGVGLVVLAVGFAVSTAISRGWIGPELQLAGALALSIALIAVGLRLRPTRMPWAHALCSGGIAALYITVASDLFLDETGSDTAFVGTVVIGIAGFALARLVPSEWVGAVTLVGGTVGWLVIAEDEPPFHASLGWFLGLVVVAKLLSLDQRWFALRLLAHGIGLLAMLGMASEAEASTEQGLVLAAAAVLYLSLLRLPSIGDLASPSQEMEIQLAAVAGPWAFGVIAVTLDLESEAPAGWTGIAVAAVTLAAALIIRRWILAAHFVSLLLGASVALSIGLALLLSTTVTFVTLAVQGAGLIVLSRSLGDSVRVLVNAAVVLFIAAVYMAGSGVEAWTDDAPVGDDISHIVIIVAVAVAAWQTRFEPTQQLGAAVVLALVLIWLGSVLVHLPEGQAAVSVSWAILGTVMLVAGAMRKVPELGAAGLGVLALTVGKLLIVDMQEVDTLWRAALFFVVGLALMRLGFLLPRLTGVVDEVETEATPADGPS